MVIAGEASGDTLGAELIAALREQGQWRFFGVGGPRLQQAGLELIYDLTAHAVVGVWEVVQHYPQLRRLFTELLSLAVRRQPDVVILVDYPGFNLRFARALKQYVRRRRPFLNWRPKVVYYVSPQLWAWHESRVHQIARDVDLMLSIFPFEKAWYAARAPQLRVEFIGHPLIDRHSNAASSSAECRAQTGSNAVCEVQPAESKIASSHTPVSKGPPASPHDSAFGIPHSALEGDSALRTPQSPFKLVLLLPGSRARELKKHVEVMVEAALKIEARAKVKWLMVLPNRELEELARTRIAALEKINLQVGGLAEALAKAHLAIASSGTVTMECACFGVPTVVLYRTSWSTYQLGKRFIKVDFIAMPNLLAQEMIYPEFIQHQATPDIIAAEAIDLLQNAPRRAAIKTKLAAVIKSLGEPGAAQRAAQAVMSLF